MDVREFFEEAKMPKQKRNRPLYGFIRMLPMCAGSTIIAALIMSLMPVSPASARIKCHNGYQNVGGSLLATPYCQDLLLAHVAHEYGMKVSARAILYNPNIKRDVCRLVGRDIRVQENCNTVLPHLHSRY